MQLRKTAILMSKTYLLCDVNKSVHQVIAQDMLSKECAKDVPLAYLEYWGNTFKGTPLYLYTAKGCVFYFKGIVDPKMRVSI